MLQIDRVLETALYVEEMGRAIEFYRRIFGFPVLLRSAEPDRLTTLDIGGAQVLLLCEKGPSVQAVVTPGGEIPPCDGSGNSHLAFPIALSQLDAWEHGRESEQGSLFSARPADGTPKFGRPSVVSQDSLIGKASKTFFIQHIRPMQSSISGMLGVIPFLN